jgi:hypothetical protein
MTAKKQRALVTSEGGVPAVPTTPGIASVAEARRALNEASILGGALSRLPMTRDFKLKEREGEVTMSDKEVSVRRYDDYGNCPECGRTNGYLYIYHEFWCYCREHKTKWLYHGGYDDGDFSDEQDARKRAILSECREVEPVFPLPEDPWEALDYIASRLEREVWGKKYKVLDAMELAIATFAVGEPTWEKYWVATFLDALLGQLSTVLGELSARPRPSIPHPIREGRNPSEADILDEIPF